MEIGRDIHAGFGAAPPRSNRASKSILQTRFQASHQGGNPAGAVTGLSTQEITVNVPSGRTIAQDVKLANLSLGGLKDETGQAMRLRFNDVDRGLPHISTHRAYEAWQRNPALFTTTPAQLVAADVSRIQNSERIKESVEAFYLQAARLAPSSIQYAPSQDRVRGRRVYRCDRKRAGVDRARPRRFPYTSSCASRQSE